MNVFDYLKPKRDDIYKAIAKPIGGANLGLNTGNAKLQQGLNTGGNLTLYSALGRNTGNSTLQQGLNTGSNVLSAFGGGGGDRKSKIIDQVKQRTPTSALQPGQVNTSAFVQPTGQQTSTTSNITPETMNKAKEWLGRYNSPESMGEKAGAYAELGKIAAAAGITVEQLVAQINGTMNTNTNIGITNSDMTALQKSIGTFENGNALTQYTTYDQIKKIADANGMTVEEVAKMFNIDNIVQPTMTDILFDTLGKSQNPVVVDNTDKITSMFQQNQQAAIDAVKHAIAKTVSMLQDQDKLIDPQYLGLKNQTDLERNLELNATEELMANMGLAQSGDNITAQVATNSAYGSKMNDLRLQQQNAHDLIRKAIAEAETDGNFEMAQLIKENGIALTQALINETNRVSSETNAQNNQAFQNVMQAIGLNNNMTQQDIDNAYRQDAFDYQKTRDAVADKQWFDTYMANKIQQDWENAFRTNEFNYQKERDKLDSQHWDAEYKLRLDEFMWSKSANNPQVKGQILENQIRELELKNLPEAQKLELAQIKQALAAGQINVDIAKTELANLRAGKTRSGGSPGGSGGSTTYSNGNTQAQNSNFQGYLQMAASGNWTPEVIINKLTETPSVANDIGPANYNKWLSDSQNINYNNLLNNWANHDSKADLVAALTNQKDYWIKMLGASNYQTLLGKANARLNDKGWG